MPSYLLNQVFSVGFASGSTIVSGSSDNTVRVWDVKTNRILFVLGPPHTDSVRCLQLKVRFNNFMIGIVGNIHLSCRNGQSF